MEEEQTSEKQDKDTIVVAEYVFNSLRLDFRRFDGFEDPTAWILKAEQFLEYQGVKEDEKGSYAAYHLDEDAQIWFQVHKEASVAFNWNRMKREVQLQYGPTTFQNFFGDLTKLK